MHITKFDEEQECIILTSDEIKDSGLLLIFLNKITYFITQQKIINTFIDSLDWQSLYTKLTGFWVDKEGQVNRKELIKHKPLFKQLFPRFVPTLKLG